MKMIIGFAVFVALAVAAPSPLQTNEAVVLVKELLHNNIGLGQYQYYYQLNDGQQKEESAELKNAGTKDEALVVKGNFSWVDPATKQEYSIRYVAGETGFHPEGVHIPSA